MHGSGKTHLLNLVAGLVPPHSGGYQLCGLYMPITDPDMADHRLNLATVFEDGGLLHQLTIRQNLELPLRYHRSPSQKDVDAAVQSLLDLTGLGPHANSLPGALPRFLLRRAGLARALILQPRAIMLANPLGGLDPRNTTWWLNALVQLSQGEKFMPGRPVAIIATTEELRPWRNTGCHVALLENGKFINLGLCPDFGRVEQPLLKEFLAGEVSQERN
jgi:ABC-type transporter Mla maintaining outer membrane lipid asymmetry ATPase subunit MlaF